MSNNRTNLTILIVTSTIAIFIAAGLSTHWFGFHHDETMTQETTKNKHLK